MQTLGARREELTAALEYQQARAERAEQAGDRDTYYDAVLEAGWLALELSGLRKLAA